MARRSSLRKMLPFCRLSPTKLQLSSTLYATLHSSRFFHSSALNFHKLSDARGLIQLPLVYLCAWQSTITRSGSVAFHGPHVGSEDGDLGSFVGLELLIEYCSSLFIHSIVDLLRTITLGIRIGGQTKHADTTIDSPCWRWHWCRW